MFPPHIFTPAEFAMRFVELLPEYLPGVDTGAFEPTDRQRCWNKTLRTVLTVMSKKYEGVKVPSQHLTPAHFKEQASLLWTHDDAAVFAVTTGWGARSELGASLEWLESFKCPQKLLIYTCSKWQEAVVDQMYAGLIRYPYHIEGEQYLFMNLIGAENRFHLLAAGMDRSGRQPYRQDSLLRLVRGSPFNWSTKRRATE
jgi:hypothetical protein